VVTTIYSALLIRRFGARAAMDFGEPNIGATWITGMSLSTSSYRFVAQDDPRSYCEGARSGRKPAFWKWMSFVSAFKTRWLFITQKPAGSQAGVERLNVFVTEKALICGKQSALMNPRR
jgi:hypothetical protein